ncbi:MAG: class I SAM-dependent methyltransferase, partial [Anaerolineales bacterium]
LQDGVPSFLEAQTPKRHKFWEWVYNRVAFGYDLGVRIGWQLALGGAPIERRSYIDKIRVRPGDRVLETAAGTGANIGLLPNHAHYFGLDISRNMLHRCQKNLHKWGREAELIHGDAQFLPFRDGVFDVVYHVGGIQFFDAPREGIREMLRAAKPGGRIWVIDETYSLPRTLKRALGNRAPSRPGGVAGLRWLAPPTGEDARIEIISKGELYCLSFKKPI